MDIPFSFILYMSSHNGSTVISCQFSSLQKLKPTSDSHISADVHPPLTFPVRNCLRWNKCYETQPLKDYGLRCHATNIQDNKNGRIRRTESSIVLKFRIFVWYIEIVYRTQCYDYNFNHSFGFSDFEMT